MAKKAVKGPEKPMARLRSKQSNVRLSDAGRAILATAVVRLGISQSAIIELALRRLAEAYSWPVMDAARPQSSGLLSEVYPETPTHSRQRRS